MTQYIRLMLDLSFCCIAILFFYMWMRLNDKYRLVKKENNRLNEDVNILRSSETMLLEEHRKLLIRYNTFPCDIPTHEKLPFLSVRFMNNLPGGLDNHAELPPRVFLQLSKAEEYPYWAEYAPLDGRDNLGQFERLRLKQLEEDNEELKRKLKDSQTVLGYTLEVDPDTLTYPVIKEFHDRLKYQNKINPQVDIVENRPILK